MKKNFPKTYEILVNGRVVRENIHTYKTAWKAAIDLMVKTTDKVSLYEIDIDGYEKKIF